MDFGRISVETHFRVMGSYIPMTCKDKNCLQGHFDSFVCIAFFRMSSWPTILVKPMTIFSFTYRYLLCLNIGCPFSPYYLGVGIECPLIILKILVSIHKLLDYSNSQIWDLSLVIRWYFLLLFCFLPFPFVGEDGKKEYKFTFLNLCTFEWSGIWLLEYTRMTPV